MLCELSQIELKSVAVGKERLAQMNALQLKEHEERLDKVIERCKMREPHKFWDTSEIQQRATKWRESRYERRLMHELRMAQLDNTVTRGVFR
jgi:hypothetical protein